MKAEGKTTDSLREVKQDSSVTKPEVFHKGNQQCVRKFESQTTIESDKNLTLPSSLDTVQVLSETVHEGNMSYEWKHKSQTDSYSRNTCRTSFIHEGITSCHDNVNLGQTLSDNLHGDTNTRISDISITKGNSLCSTYNNFDLMIARAGIGGVKSTHVSWKQF